MNSINRSFRFLVFLLTASVLLSGCHSFYEIPKTEYNNISQIDEIKVVYNNGKEFVVEKDDTTNINFLDSMLVVQCGIDKTIINIKELSKLKERRFDLGGTLTISIIAIVLIILSLPRFSM
jgi:hypothetical protein